MTFSERYGYTKVSDVIIRERMTPEIQNAICSCFDDLKIYLRLNYGYTRLELHLWSKFLNRRKSDFGSFQNHYAVATYFIEESNNPWNRKLDIIETSIKYLIDVGELTTCNKFIKILNEDFERLNFGYRIIDNLIVDIVSDLEIETIEKAIDENTDNVSMHLNKALALYSQRTNPDYQNAIKEAISAVEAVNRNITGDSNLNLKKMEGKGLSIPSVLTNSFNILYGYTNAPTTGIRHALMDENSEYVPKAEEALYMIITCSAFINYLNGKMK